MKDILKKIEKNKLCLTLDKEIYTKEAILAAAYKFTDRCAIFVEPRTDSKIDVYFEIKGSTSIDTFNSNLKQDYEIILREMALKYCNEVLDQQLQLDLENQYGNIRELIVKHAFSPLDNLKEEIKIND